VLVIPESAAVESVRAALGHDVNNRALIAAVLGREVVRNDLVFSYLVLKVHEQRRTGHAQVVVVGAVNLEVVRTTTISVDRQAGAALVDNARGEQGQRVETSACAVGRQIGNLSRVNSGGQLCLIALHNLFSAGRDRHRFGYVTRFEGY